jgi:two-component system alkaline phosphatase synthesis response regulator PhoP
MSQTTDIDELNVLIAEDDANIAAGLADLLRGEGYRVTVAADGRAALEAFRRAPPDIVLLDIMMPHVNGYDVCREIRRTDPRAAILFLSAKSEEIDRVIGLELGADDFINKPFGVKEVLARIRAVSRRCLAGRAAPATEAGAPAPFRIGDLDVYPAELRARRGETTVDLSLRDVRILTLLHRETGRVVDRDHFFRVCWGLDHLPNSRTLDQHISKLRRRIERDPDAPTIIRTVHGVGYRHEA